MMNTPEEKIDIRQELNEIFALFQQKGAEERASIIIRSWFDLVEEKNAVGETVPEELEQSFYRWLDAPGERHIKDMALWHVFNEQLQTRDRTEIGNDIPFVVPGNKKEEPNLFINIKN